jgi:hypothetical protein
MSPIIFIDIDGPLAWNTWQDGKVEITETVHLPFEIPYAWVKEDCDALAKIIDATKADLVISSDWKKHFTMPQLKAIFLTYGIPHWSVLDTTTHFNPRKKMSSSPEWDRACEIHSWVKCFRPHHWVAIDDMPLKLSFQSLRIPKWRHIQVDGDWGQGGRLRDKIDETIKLLKR